MKKSQWIYTALRLLVVLALGGGLGYWYANRAQEPGAIEPASTGEQPEPVASVQVAPVQEKTISETLEAFGTVVAAVGKSETFSVPYESRVRRVRVTSGQVVAEGDALLEVEPSPDTQLALEQAREQVRAAQRQVSLTQDRLALKLATRQDLSSSQDALTAANLHLKSLEDRGVGAPAVLKATTSGVVTNVAAQEGQIVAAGSVLAEVIGESQINVRLGIESEDVGHLASGQAVKLYPVNAPQEAPLDGRIRLITQEVNPQTRLVDVFVEPTTDVHLLLNDYVRGEIVAASANGLVVPRTAVLPEGGRYTLYTVEKDRAVKHVVDLGIETEDELQVRGDVQVGQKVVVVGNSQLEDGMSVAVERGQ